MLRTSSAAVVAVAALLAAEPALANPKGAGGPPEKAARGGEETNVTIVLGERHRTIVRDHYQRNCPPGLAKKNNGCLPPGQAKKRYAVGRPIPQGVEIDILPGEVIVRLPPLPDGYGYRMVDGDLVVVALASLVIADAIGLL